MRKTFQLNFEILTNDKLEAARTGNWLLENNLVIARLDKLSRNEDVQQKLQVPECRWDLVVGGLSMLSAACAVAEFEQGALWSSSDHSPAIDHCRSVRRRRT
jgi:hypothetical protein